jgi:tetrahydromethanopterin S-methyltransferase subunit G
LQELRSLLLTRELLDMPQNLAEFAESVNRQFEAIDKQFEAINQRFEAIDRQFEAINRRFEAIDRRFDNLEADVEQLKVDVGYLKGKSLETEMPGRALSRLEYRFNISRPRLVRASTHYQPAHDFTDAVYEASKVGDLIENQHRRILDTDMIVQGRGADTGKDTYVAVESSVHHRRQ